MLVHLDLNFRVSSTLINDNKIIVQDHESDRVLVFNIDMKVFWKINKELTDKLEELGGEAMNFIPDCGTEGMVCRVDNSIKLVHTNLSKEIEITNSSINPPKSIPCFKAYMPNDNETKQIIVVSAEVAEDNTIFTAHKVSWYSLQKKKMVVIED